MACDELENRKGEVLGHMCSRGRRRKVPCCVPGCGADSRYLCDAELRPGKTCDKPMCAKHRHRQANVERLAEERREHHLAPDDRIMESVDFCPDCAAAPAPPRQLGLFPGAR